MLDQPLVLFRILHPFSALDRSANTRTRYPGRNEAIRTTTTHLLKVELHMQHTISNLVHAGCGKRCVPAQLSASTAWQAYPALVEFSGTLCRIHDVFSVKQPRVKQPEPPQRRRASSHAKNTSTSSFPSTRTDT